MTTRKFQVVSHLTLRLALRLLAHPISLGAAALLLANDLLLRRFWPSWWAGKIGDAAWLVFAPWMLAALAAAFASAAAWIFSPAQQRLKPALDRQNGWTAEKNFLTAAVLITAAGFGLVKTVPALHLLTTRIFAEILGTPPSLVRDPSDLLTLPALLIPLALLRREARARAHIPVPRPAHALRSPVVSPWQWIALPLAALVLLGDAAAPNTGIRCLEVRDSRIYAVTAYYFGFVSTDGGRTWQPGQSTNEVDCPAEATAAAVDGWQQAEGPREGLVYRYRAGDEIQTSSDSGQTWKTAYALEAVSDAERYYILKTRQGSTIYEPGPLDALADPQTGSMLFAMGQEGVLIHDSAGQWLWSPAGGYRHVDRFPDADAFVTLLGPMIILSVLLALLVYANLAMRYTGGRLRTFVLVLAWLAWLAVAVIFPPPGSYAYFDMVPVLGILAGGILVIPLVIEQTFKLVKIRASGTQVQIGKIAGYALIGGLVYFKPFLMWLYGLLPSFDVAIIAGLVIAIALVGAGFAALREKRGTRF